MSKNQNFEGRERKPSGRPEREYGRQQSKTDYQSNKSLYAIFLPYDTQKNELKTYFSAFGDVLRMTVGINYVKKYSYTYVEFNTVEEARHAFRSCDRVFKGQRFKLMFKGQSKQNEKSKYLSSGQDQKMNEKNSRDQKYPKNELNSQKQRKQQSILSNNKFREGSRPKYNREQEIQKKDRIERECQKSRDEGPNSLRRNRQKYKRRSDNIFESTKKMKKRSRSRELIINKKLKKKSVSQSRSISL